MLYRFALCVLVSLTIYKSKLFICSIPLIHNPSVHKHLKAINIDKIIYYFFSQKCPTIIQQLFDQCALRVIGLTVTDDEELSILYQLLAIGF